MKRVAVLSDTHGLLRPEVLDVLRSADVILHAGDINSQNVVDTIRSCGESYFVRGNNDKEWAAALPHDLHVNVEGVRFFMVHNKKEVPPSLADVDIVLYGHSHKYACMEKNGVFWLNPGSCGPRRFDQEITMCVLQVDGTAWQAEKFTIPHSERH